MGAPGVLTDFYFHKNNDFCSDLVQWTSEILDDENPPWVHSVSYGFQGNISTLGCSDAQVDNVDTNFAKLAARGVTIIISSGDSGSGYKVNCNNDHIVDGVAVTAGTVLKTV